MSAFPPGDVPVAQFQRLTLFSVCFFTDLNMKKVQKAELERSVSNFPQPPGGRESRTSSLRPTLQASKFVVDEI